MTLKTMISPVAPGIRGSTWRRSEYLDKYTPKRHDNTHLYFWRWTRSPHFTQHFSDDRRCVRSGDVKLLSVQPLWRPTFTGVPQRCGFAVTHAQTLLTEPRQLELHNQYQLLHTLYNDTTITGVTHQFFIFTNYLSVEIEIHEDYLISEACHTSHLNCIGQKETIALHQLLVRPPIWLHLSPLFHKLKKTHSTKMTTWLLVPLDTLLENVSICVMPLFKHKTVLSVAFKLSPCALWVDQVLLKVMPLLFDVAWVSMTSSHWNDDGYLSFTSFSSSSLFISRGLL